MIFLLLMPLSIFWKKFSEMSNIKQYIPIYWFQILFEFYSLHYWIVWCDQHIFWNLIVYIIATIHSITKMYHFSTYISIFIHWRLLNAPCVHVVWYTNWGKFVYCVIFVFVVLHANFNWYYVTCTRPIKFDNFGNIIDCRNNIDWDESNDV